MGAINVLLNYPSEGKEAVQKMMHTTEHRTAGSSTWTEAAPGVFASGSLWKSNGPEEAGFPTILLWDGVLDNVQELKNELLEQGVIFRSGADEEVLIHWLRIKGEQGVGELQGMFVLAFIDRDTKNILLARDPSGQKPLYYSQNNHQWVFSSEARGIVATGLAGRILNTFQYLPYFYSRHSFPDQSFFQGVRQIVPGEVMVIDFSGQLVLRKRITFRHSQSGWSDLPQFREMVLDAVLKGFSTEAKVGLVLSGGVDSSLLLHTWYQETGLPLHTFTANFGSSYSRKYLDSRFASALAEKYHCAHHEIVITPESVLQHWDEYIAALDQPIGDSASFMSWMIAKEAKPHVQVLITGAGADELFGGYDRHRAFRFYLKYRKQLQFLSGIRWLIPLCPRRLKKLLKGIAESDDETFLNFASLQTVPERFRKDFLRYFPQLPSAYKAALTFDLEYYLVNDVLKLSDNAAMTHGLEARAPYMDAAFVSLSQNMTEEQHLSLRPKHWLKVILEEDGLEEIAARRKAGFGLPLREWLKEDSAFTRRMFETIRQFDFPSDVDIPEDFRKLVRDPEAHVKEDFLQLWNMFVLASWKEQQGL